MWFDAARKRVALVVSHPDDETFAAGAHLKYWPHLTIIHVTDGAPRDGADARREGFTSWSEYADARRAELECALCEGEAGHAKRIELGIADQEAIIEIACVIGRLGGPLREAEIVITHSYEGGHPDHDACALACRAALPPGAELWEFAGYHLRNGMVESGEFLGRNGDETRVELCGADLDRKNRMLACFKTQCGVLNQLRHDVETFRRAPDADFSKPPHPGGLLYETWNFALDGVRWRELVREALQCH